MTDIYDKATRSYVMSRIKSKNTKPEIIVRKYLHKKGFRFRIHVKKLPGKPDIVLKRFQSVIFVNGCFWHGHEKCKYYIVPKTRRSFWVKKISQNRKRDNANIKMLRNQGWHSHIIWGCELKQQNIDKTLKKLSKKLKRIKLRKNINLRRI